LIPYKCLSVITCWRQRWNEPPFCRYGDISQHRAARPKTRMHTGPTHRSGGSLDCRRGNSKLSKKKPDGLAAGRATENPTHAAASHTRDDVGAGDGRPQSRGLQLPKEARRRSPAPRVTGGAGALNLPATRANPSSRAGWPIAPPRGSRCGREQPAPAAWWPGCRPGGAPSPALRTAGHQARTDRGAGGAACAA